MNAVARSCVWVLLLGSFAAPLHAEMVTARWGTPPRQSAGRLASAKRPVNYVTETATAPEIDGKLADAVWSRAQVLRLDRTLNGESRAAQPTWVRILRDRKRLYIAFRCIEPLNGKIRASVRDHDEGVWNDDSVEIFLGPAQGTYYHFGVNAVGSTYDGRVKEASWNSGMKAAASKDKDGWTAEIAIPLEKIKGQGALPHRWKANFTRNRHTRGQLEESAWSPTFRGSSHVPERFGELCFTAPPAEKETAPASRPEAGNPGVAIFSCRGGEGVVRFDLSSLTRKNLKIYRAELLVFRSAQITARDPEGLVDLAIHPLFEAFEGGEAPVLREAPLKLRAPWFDRFDATEAVRRWVAGETNGGFLVKTFPFWNARGTCLDIAYEGAPQNAPPQVTGLHAFHRAGQTFITWKEIENPVGRDSIRWSTLRAALANLDLRRKIRYCIYRSRKPITAATLPDSQLLARVKPLSCWNINGRNVEKPIDEVLASQYSMMHGHWNPFGGATVEGEFGQDCRMECLVIRDGKAPLSRGTGLYVHTATKAGAPYYAVVTSVDGVQNSVTFSKENSLIQPVEEGLAEPQPVLQKELPRRPYWNYPDRRLHYVRWVAPPYGNLPYQYYNWGVAVPRELGASVPLELSLHREGRSYYRTQYRIERDSIVLSPHDFPLKSWWYGYHASQGTLKSFRQGSIHNYTERRLLSFIDWAARKWPVDRNRILVTSVRRISGSHHPSGDGSGSSGALHLGIRHPDVFNMVQCGYGLTDYAAVIRALRKGDRLDFRGRAVSLPINMEKLWGRIEWGLKTGHGKNVWDELNLAKTVRELPVKTELPFITLMRQGARGTLCDFFNAMLDGGRPIMADFGYWRSLKLIPVSVTGTWPKTIRVDVRKNLGLPVFRGSARLKEDGLKYASKGLFRFDGAKTIYGEFNLGFRWKDPEEKIDRYAVTLWWERRRHVRKVTTDVILRRLQKFKVETGKRYRWEFKRLEEGGGSLRKGTVTVGKDGLLAIPALQVSVTPGRLVVRPE